MAYTRIHGIKVTLNKALAYIENPEKTEHQLLVSGYNVDPLSASVEFSMTAALGREVKGDYRKTGGADNLAYHMIQSFAPYDKITPEEAHEVGKKWANEILQGKYEYVISTHVDKGHIHNHIIFNATSFLDFSKFNNYKVAAHLREVSDRLCRERGLYVIENPNLNQHGKSHHEWEQWQRGTSWKAQIGRLIDDAISKTDNFKDFQKVLNDLGVEIKDGARISFRMTNGGQQRFCRGDRIGDNYSRDGILKRLSQPLSQRRADAARSAERYDRRVTKAARKSRIAQTKQLASALITIRQERIEGPDEFASKIEELTAKAVSVHKTIGEYETRRKQYTQAAKYLLTVRNYSPLASEAEKQTIFTRAKFMVRHEKELTELSHAVEQLEKMGVSTNVDPDKVMGLVKQQLQHSADLNNEVTKIEKRIEALRTVQGIVASIQEPQIEKDHNLGRQETDQRQER